MIRVSVIIVNYNGKGLTVGCLKVLERQTFRNFEVLVVDNASSDDSLYEIQRFLKEHSEGFQIKLIPLDNNTGFSGGNVVGLKHASGEHIALLNNDTEPGERWLEELVNAMDKAPEVGICASKLIAYGTDIIDSAGDGFSTSLKGFKRGEGENLSLYEKQEYIFGACAGAALYRRTMIEKIGFLDEDFFLIHEDTDLNLRAQIYGWKVLYVPKALVYHKVRSTIGNMSKMALYYTLRNSEFVRIKNIPASLFPRKAPELILGTLAEIVYFGIRYHSPLLYLKAKMDVVKMLPVMLKKRRAIMGSMQITNEELLKIMTPVFEKKFLKNKIRKFIFG
ncbi:MAG: glycosyltransferase family 2 protein [Deltaproteobacteria bacterium]|nr:glycosyltransferase family 2 protein [Deltaproteobacteria bacterium]